MWAMVKWLFRIGAKTISASPIGCPNGKVPLYMSLKNDTFSLWQYSIV